MDSGLDFNHLTLWLVDYSYDEESFQSKSTASCVIMSYVCFHVLSHPLPVETCLMMQETHCRCQAKRHPLAEELKLYSDDRAPTQSRPSAPSAQADAWFCFETSSNQCTYMWRLDGCLLKSVARKGWTTTAHERVCGPPDVNSFAGYWKGSILFQLLREQPKTFFFCLTVCGWERNSCQRGARDTEEMFDTDGSFGEILFFVMMTMMNIWLAWLSFVGQPLLPCFGSLDPKIPWSATCPVADMRGCICICFVLSKLTKLFLVFSPCLTQAQLFFLVQHVHNTISLSVRPHVPRRGFGMCTKTNPGFASGLNTLWI